MKASGTSVRTALSLSFLRTCVSFACGVATVMVLSRLLTPTEIGVYSVAAALVALAHMLRDFGVSELIIQEKELSDDVVRTAFAVNLIIAWGLAAALLGASGLIGDFYRNQGAAEVTRALSLLFVIMPFGTTTLAYMKREMQFGLLVKLQIAEQVTRSTCAIALAYAGFSYMSMAWASVGSMAVLVGGAAIWGGRYRVRGPGFSEWRRVLHFGSNRTIADIAVQVGSRSADIVVGRMLGVEAAGFYSRGNGIVNLFRTNVGGAVGAVAFPALARDHRETDTAPLLFRKSLMYETAIGWPFFTFAALMALPMMRIAFGDQWDAAVPLMRWLSCAAIVGVLIYHCNGMLVAVGRYREATKLEVQFQIARIALTVIAAFHSLEAVAAAQIPICAMAVMLYYRKLGCYAALRFRPLVMALAPSAALATVTSIPPLAVLLLWPGSISTHLVPVFLVAAVGAGAVWLAGIFVLRHPLSTEVGNILSVVWKRIGIAPKAT